VRLTLLALAATAVATSNAGAQFRPTKLTNLKYYSKTTLLPNSGYAHRAAAGAYLAVGHTASAISMYEKALAINANDRQAQQALAALRARP
jgi:tetratricopeptide (TPR) repeat protein